MERLWLCALILPLHMDIRHIARLARIELNSEEILRYQTQIDQLIQYVEKLTELDLDDIHPTSHAVEIFDVMRPDEARDGALSLEEVLMNSPSVTQEQFRLPKVVE